MGMNYWNVPYIGQVGSGANEHYNDCGPTSAGMVIKFYGANFTSIDALFNEVQPSGDSYTSFGDICKLWDARGIDADYAQEVTLGELYEYLVKGAPVVALIHYGALESVRPNSFKGSHFVVVIGMDLQNVYIHDPLNNVSTGERVPVPINLWISCWSTLGDLNPQRSILIPSMGETPPEVLRTVYPRDYNGCNVRSVAGGTGASTKLFAVPYDATFTKTTSRMQVYEIKILDRTYDRNWGRIHPTQNWWVCLDYTVEK
jgi:hypothetical protein